MADDVASFFKSKKTKKQAPGHHHSANVQTPDELARRLERTVQHQQIIDRENGAEENEDEFEQQRPAFTQQVSGSGGGSGAGAGAPGEQNEESEWLDYHEQQEVDLAKVGIKEMEIREESEDEANEDEESLANRKTWNLPGQQQDKNPQKAKKVTYAAGMDVDDAEEGVSADDKTASTTKAEESEKKDEEKNTEHEATKSEADNEDGEKKSKYVPPSMRNKQLTAAYRPTMKKPNIEDSMEFPSLAAAGELEAEIEKIKKKKPTQPQSYSAFSKKAASPAPADNSRRITPSAVAKEEPEPVPAGPVKSAYVPPHLRKRGGDS